MWFKNLYIYKLQDTALFNDEDELTAALESKQFTPCADGQRESTGWVPPLGKGTESIIHRVGNCILLKQQKQDKILPPSVIKDELDERLEAINESEGRKVGAKEKKEMREQIEFELMPRAFDRNKFTDGYLDLDAGYLIINSASAKQAEEFTGLLRKTIGTLPVTTPETKINPGTLMTEWLSSGAMPAAFELGEECELKSQGEDKSAVVFKKHELMAEEVQSNLENGKRVSRLHLIWGDKIGFKMTDELQLKSIKFLDIFDEKLNEHDPESHAEKLDIEFSLMTGEVRLLLNDLMAELSPDVSQEEATKATFAVPGDAGVVDSLYEQVVVELLASDDEVVLASRIVRSKHVEFERAFEMLEQMEKDGVVTPVDDKGVRRVIRGEKEEAHV